MFMLHVTCCMLQKNGLSPEKKALLSEMFFLEQIVCLCYMLRVACCKKMDCLRKKKLYCQKCFSFNKLYVYVACYVLHAAKKWIVSGKKSFIVRNVFLSTNCMFM